MHTPHRGRRAQPSAAPKKAAKSKPSRPAAAKLGVSFEQVVALANELPGTVEATSYGTRSLKVDKTLFARLKEDGETLVLKMDLVSRDLVLVAQPNIFYLTDHYRDYPYVLVRLAAVNAARMRELLEDAWRLAAARRTVQAHDARGEAKPAAKSPEKTPAKTRRLRR